jgi:hypothetical protein
MILYHGTGEPDFAPRFGGGRDYHDYGNGFYTTEDLEASKEWACQGEGNTAFVYVYELDDADLNILNLGENNTLEWVSVLMTWRRSKKIRGAALERCNKMIERYSIDVGKYDVIRGFRANDSYFQFTADFVTDTITIETLMKSIVAGNLGYQVCVKSKKAYEKLGRHKEAIKITGEEYTKYHDSYLAKDTDARALAIACSNESQDGKLLSRILEEGA